MNVHAPNPALMAATAYIDRGWSPVRVHPGQKRPCGDRWQETEITSVNVGAYFATPANVGVKLGSASGGLCDVDLDCDEAVQLAGAFMPPTDRTFWRGKQPRHRLYVSDLHQRHDRATLKFDDPSGGTIVELRIGGGDKGAQTIFPPSTHPSGDAITWIREGEAAYVAADALEGATRKLAAACLLRRHWPGDGQRHDAQLALSGWLTRCGWDEDEVAGFLKAVAGEPSKRQQTARDSTTADKTYGWPKLAALLGEPIAKKAAVWLQVGAGKSAAGFRHDNMDLVRDDKGRPHWCPANAIRLLKGHPDWHGVLGYNGFRDRRVVLKPLPGQEAGMLPRDLHDDDYVSAAEWFNANGFPRAGAASVEGPMRRVCSDNAFDPLEGYLRSLRWDGVVRLETWLRDFLGAEDGPYTAEVGLRWCISAVARALKPGCKADCMLVLEGAQGARKSTALRILAGEGRFGDALPPMGTKDASSYLRGLWIIEVAELEAMRREVDTIKAFLSRQHEDFRKAYGREEERFPRRCVFAGTTNKDHWQRDETGGRRFWPVRVGLVDLEALTRDRDQLWAEAVALFDKGERWWLEGEAEELARTEVADRALEDPLEAAVARLLEGRDETCPTEVIDLLREQAEKKGTRDDLALTEKDAQRVARLLRGIGFGKKGRLNSGRYRNATRYIRGAN